MILIVFIVALFMDKLNIFTTIYKFVGMPIFICIVLFSIISFFELHLKDLIYLKVVNYFDCGIVIVFFSTIMYLIYYLNFEFPVNIYKLYFLIVLIIINFGLLLFRNFHITHNKIEKYNTNIIDLKDAYDNKFPNSESNLYFIDESPVEYDMLDRNSIINEIYTNIKECKTEKQYVIGLTGEWGSGKTTILNNVKKLIKDYNDGELIVIDSFDPWVYENKTAMFKAMFDAILSKIDLKFSIIQTNKYIDYLADTIFGYSKLEKFKFSRDREQEINRIRNIIND